MHGKRAFDDIFYWYSRFSYCDGYTDIAYIAGLFDGEGSIHFKRGIEKKKKHKGEGYRLSNSMRISMEITMTDHSVLIWLHEVLGVGTLRPKTVKGRPVKMELNT